MTITEAIKKLEALRFEHAPDREAVDAFNIALAYLRDREAHWEQQRKLAEKGGHGPGSDF